MNEVLSTPQIALFVKMGLMAWETYIGRVNKLLNELPDETLAQQVAPGRNTGTYLLGHLTATHDAMLPALGLGERLYPELEQPFLTSPDGSGLPVPSLQQLREYWAKVNATLAERMATLQPEEWLNRHTIVSEADFAREPHRNKLNLLINRTNHLSYHLGQLIFLKSKG
jgi:hypothetical protein